VEWCSIALNSDILASNTKDILNSTQLPSI